ncbi:hypothetical protein ONS95_006055 [Cadophora gregata]|uniref:uncharacterized protein n=1 Tax=Cadophora gregata TaxID=51156 RepID=UPI0026DD6A29|nr:uncharacterized protein ONS95_006055 [Cadophora gregata]KAK0102436.1 hypothetical protein ONS95_006055 [Cadophora gregata]
MCRLTSLPYEVLANVADSLSFDDVFNLGRASRHFLFLLKEERICKSFVQTKIKYSKEAQEAVKNGGGNARALRIAAKRREAITSAYPFTVATIGFCDAYIYRRGILCYTLDDRIRILDLHRSAQEEFVVSIPSLLTEALSDIGDNNTGTFKCLYYSDGILSCIYDASDEDSPVWLIAFHVETMRILVTHELESTDKIFVRHNSQYLYYGTHSELGTDGYKKWVICGYEYKTRKWFDHKVHLPDMVGSEIGSTICFELYRNSFYALSNQTSFEVEEIDWTSFYHCVRFLLDSPMLLEKTENKSMWRRQHQEGPIDDRWTSLSLDEDESTGELKIVEARKEWYLGCSTSQRTYYTTDIVFPVKDHGEDSSIVPDSPQAQNFVLPTISSWAPAASSDQAQASSSTEVDAMISSSSSTAAPTGVEPTATESDEQDVSDLPNIPLLRLLQKDDHPHHMNAPNRRPERTHPGNDGSTYPTHTLAKSRIRAYFTPCSTHLDLVDDPHPDDWQGKQRLRLRAGTRRIGPVLRDPVTNLIRRPHPDLNIALGEMYRVPPITYWPKAQKLHEPDEHIDAIYRLMNPPSHLGNVEGTADERSLVYVTGGCDQPQALIFVGFDPSIKLAGVKQWGGLSESSTKKQKGVGEGPHIDGRATGHHAPSDSVHWIEGLEGQQEGTYVDVYEADRTVSIDVKGKGKAVAGPSRPTVHFSAGYSTIDVCESPATYDIRGGLGRRTWVWREAAMYRDIGLGLYFGMDRPRDKSGEIL